MTSEFKGHFGLESATSILLPTIKLLANLILSKYSSTEASFSTLNNIKSNRRSSLTEEHLRLLSL